MEPLGGLSFFFENYEKITRQLRLLIPSLNDGLSDSLRPHLNSTRNQSDEEVYAGLPTLHNSRPLFKALALCIPSGKSDFPEQISKLPARQLLNRLELVAIIANVYELHSTEAAAWRAVEALSRHTQRVIDEIYGLVNRAFLKLRTAELSCFANREDLTHKVERVQSALRSKAFLVAAYKDLVTRVKLPTTQMNLKCVVVDALLAYIEHYYDWFATRSSLDIVMLRHKDFLDSKIWAAVYCRAFINWLILRARLSTGSPPIPITDDDIETPVSSLFAAMNIKTHGRTLVKFIINHIEEKAGHRNLDKENQIPSGSFSSKRLTESDVSVPDMVNLWLGSRLLLNGTFQVAELYTLLGTIKEARVYQLELLRISQRFHIPSCAQSAICMMAYTDLLSQRKWAFDLRLNQLNHILNSSVSLDDVVKSRQMLFKKGSDGGAHGGDGDDGEENGFLKHGKEKNRLYRGLNESISEEEYDGMATNPVVDAMAGGLVEVYPISPMKGTVIMNSATGYPSIQNMVSAISSKSGQKAVEEEEGIFTSVACAHKILNGCLWLWVGEVANLVRTQVTIRDHFFPSLVPPNQVSDECAPSDDLSALLDSQCTLSSCAVLATPAQPITKAARAALRTVKRTLPVPLTSIEKECVLDKSVQPPDAPRRLAPSRLNGGHSAIVPESRECSGDAKDAFKADFVFGKGRRTPLHILQKTNVQEHRLSTPEYSDLGGGDEVRLSSEENKEEAEDPVESCPAIAFRTFLPRNLRMAKQHLLGGRSSCITLASPSCLRDPPETLAKAQDVLADHLYSAYSSLATLPVPHLLRPVCQWLGLRWLGRGNQSQAARYFGQATGIAACGLFTSILSSKLKIKETAQSLRSVYGMSAPNDSSAYLDTHAATLPSIKVVQFMVVDEFGQLQTFENCENDGTQPARDLIVGGLGSRKRMHLIATRWVLEGGKSFLESRILHKFSSTGSQYLKDFSDLQGQNAESMQEEDRRRFWSLRFSLDSRLRKLIDEMRDEWFTTEDLEWIRTQDSSQSSFNELPCILVLDRQLTLLPWEWLIWGQWDENVVKWDVPAVCRNFSVSLVVGHLNLIKSHVAKFDPDSAFYVVNPEANLPHTESTFKSYFNQNFSKWSGILGRMPQTQEVVQGFTQKDLFVYLGHGNGSKFLMSAFDEGQNSKAVAFIIGCSSGRPRLEGRHEAYASVFNHLIIGAPTAISLLWDVTDKDIDRFTQRFIDQWILLKDGNGTKPSSMTLKIFKATKACKLQSLVAKSVIVYGIPAVPVRQQE